MLVKNLPLLGAICLLLIIGGKVLEAMQASAKQMQEVDGLTLFQEGLNPKGWKSDQPPEDWSDEIRELFDGSRVVLISPRNNIISYTARQARIFFKNARKKYGDEIVGVIVADEEAILGMNMGIIKLSDLRKSAEQLQQEELKVIGQDDEKAHMLHLAYLIITGHRNTK